jgi:hypothetical protein
MLFAMAVETARCAEGNILGSVEDADMAIVDAVPSREARR